MGRTKKRLRLPETTEIIHIPDSPVKEDSRTVDLLKCNPRVVLERLNLPLGMCTIKVKTVNITGKEAPVVQTALKQPIIKVKPIETLVGHNIIKEQPVTRIKLPASKILPKPPFNETPKQLTNAVPKKLFTSRDRDDSPIYREPQKESSVAKVSPKSKQEKVGFSKVITNIELNPNSHMSILQSRVVMQRLEDTMPIFSPLRNKRYQKRLLNERIAFNKSKTCLYNTKTLVNLDEKKGPPVEDKIMIDVVNEATPEEKLNKVGFDSTNIEIPKKINKSKEKQILKKKNSTSESLSENLPKQQLSVSNENPEPEVKSPKTPSIPTMKQISGSKLNNSITSKKSPHSSAIRRRKIGRPKGSFSVAQESFSETQEPFSETQESFSDTQGSFSETQESVSASPKEDFTPRSSARIQNKKEKFSARRMLGLLKESDTNASSHRFKPMNNAPLIKPVKKLSYVHPRGPENNSQKISPAPQILQKEEMKLSLPKVKEEIRLSSPAESEEIRPSSPKEKEEIHNMEIDGFEVDLGPEIIITRVKKNPDISSDNTSENKKVTPISNDDILSSKNELKEPTKFDKPHSIKPNHVKKKNVKPFPNTVSNSVTLEETEKIISESLPDVMKPNDISEVGNMERGMLKGGGSGISHIKQMKDEGSINQNKSVSKVKPYVRNPRGRPPKRKQLNLEMENEIENVERVSESENKQIKKTAKVTPMTPSRFKGQASEVMTKEVAVQVNIRRASKEKSLYDNMEDDYEINEKVLKTQTQNKKNRLTKSPKVENKEKPFDVIFDRYFLTRYRLCEHNDSLVSSDDDSSDTSCISHFKSVKESETFPPNIINISKSPKIKETASLNELMEEISIELPGWNLHLMEDTNTFCIACTTRGRLGIPIMKKIIELDTDYNARVYINQAFRSEFCGVYNTYDSIKQLIYALDKL